MWWPTLRHHWIPSQAWALLDDVTCSFVSRKVFLYTLYEKLQTAAVYTYSRPDRLFDIENEIIFDNNYWPCTIFIRPRSLFFEWAKQLIVFRYHLPTHATTFIYWQWQKQKKWHVIKLFNAVLKNLHTYLFVLYLSISMNGFIHIVMIQE